MSSTVGSAERRALVSPQTKLESHGNDSREGSLEKIHTMRELCSADAPNRFRYQGSRDDRLRLQMPEVRANAYENAQVRRINADPSSTVTIGSTSRGLSY